MLWSEDIDILLRLEAVAGMMVRGAKAFQVAQALDVSLATAKRDIARVRELWRTELREDVAEYRQESMAQIRTVQQQAWTEWDKDKGNTRFLEIILSCEKEIIGLTGAKAPEQLHVFDVGADHLDIVVHGDGD